MYKEIYKNNLSATFLQRFSHSSRFKIVKKIFLKETINNNLILDFGTGDGEVFKYYLEGNPSNKFYGYDISSEMINQASTELKKKVYFTNNINDISLNKYHFISCLETLEHINEADVMKVLKLLSSLLAKNGKLLISVPVEIGPTSLFKQIVRNLSGQKEIGSNLRTIFLSLFFRTEFINRNKKYPGHLGFNFFKLKKSFKSADLRIIKTIYSPFPFLNFLFNSQVFFLIENI